MRGSPWSSAGSVRRNCTLATNTGTIWPSSTSTIQLQMMSLNRMIIVIKLPYIYCPQGRGKVCQKPLCCPKVLPILSPSCSKLSQSCLFSVSQFSQVLSNLCQDYVKDVSNFCHSCLKVDSKLSKVVFKFPKFSQSCVKGVAKMSKSCLKDVVKVSQSCLKNVLKLSQCCL